MTFPNPLRTQNAGDQTYFRIGTHTSLQEKTRLVDMTFDREFKDFPIEDVTFHIKSESGVDVDVDTHMLVGAATRAVVAQGKPVAAVSDLQISVNHTLVEKAGSACERKRI